jgi:aspartyl protease family protein
MRYIVIAVAAAVALGLLVGAGAGGLFGLTQQQAGTAVPLVVLLAVLAAGLIGRGRRAGEWVRGLALWIGIFGIVLVGYTYRSDLSAIGARVFGELMPGQAIVSDAGSVSFRRGRDGHFQLNASVNGASIPLIFDTGATAVVLTADDARRAGIDTGSLVYGIPVSTANGTGRAAAVTLDEIDIGGIVRHGIRAFVAEDGALETSLLGMTFLETLQSYTVRQNALELIG